MFSMSTGQAVSHQPQVVHAQNVSGGTTVGDGRERRRGAASRAAGSFARASAVSAGAASTRWCRIARFTSLWLSGLPVT